MTNDSLIDSIARHLATVLQYPGNARTEAEKIYAIVRQSEISLEKCAEAIIESEQTPIKMLDFKARGYAKAVLDAAGVKYVD